MSNPQFIIARPGSEGIVSPQQYTDMFVFLHREWLDADKYLEDAGFPIQIEVEGQLETRTLAQRMRLKDTQEVNNAQ